jgi:hypothetical protein
MTDPGKEIPESVEHAPYGYSNARDVVIANAWAQHFALDRGMFLIRFKMDAEIAIIPWISEPVMFL